MSSKPSTPPERTYTPMEVLKLQALVQMPGGSKSGVQCETCCAVEPEKPPLDRPGFRYLDRIHHPANRPHGHVTQ